MKIIVGIDEVGRGPLAGPVTVGVVACSAVSYQKLKHLKSLPALGKDSKKLTAQRREEYAPRLKALADKKQISYAVVHISNTIIDTRGISFAIKKAMAQGIGKLKLNPRACQVLLDGGLRAPLEFQNQKTIIKGDEKEKIIAWASILAKVSRDALMARYHRKYPQYGLAQHKGYGTATHREAIQTHGLSPLHRRSFCKRLI